MHVKCSSSDNLHYFYVFSNSKSSLCVCLSAVKIKKNKDNVKFKVRCSRYLYTLVITDKEKAEKLKQSLPPGQYRQEVGSVSRTTRSGLRSTQ